MMYSRLGYAGVQRVERHLCCLTDPALIALVQQIRTERNLAMKDLEAHQLFRIAEASGKVPGDWAEVGTYQGASARLLCEARPANRPFHLFDTFAGIPHKSEYDPLYGQGQFSSDLESIREYLAPYPDVFIYPGVFPGTGESVADRTFAFVNLDVDVYQSTLESLQFFYPRMSPGGVLVSHDYSYAEGVQRAFEEFFADKPEAYFPIGGSHCMFVKLP
jgi:hypothetical protein